MTTQLRLVEPPEPRSRPGKTAGTTAGKRTTKAPSKGTVGRPRTATRSSRSSARRSASWGDWRLDAGTRQVGRAGVAQARRALEAALEQTALEQELSRAS